jgi:hypothetical protein
MLSHLYAYMTMTIMSGDDQVHNIYGYVVETTLNVDCIITCRHTIRDNLDA